MEDCRESYDSKTVISLILITLAKTNQMYTLFTNEDKTNLYLISQRSSEHGDYASCKQTVMQGSKAKIMVYLQENYAEDVIETLY